MLNTIRDSIFDKVNAKDFMTVIREKFKESDKAKMANLMSSFTNFKYETIRDVCNFILKKV